MDDKNKGKTYSNFLQFWRKIYSHFMINKFILLPQIELINMLHYICCLFAKKICKRLTKKFFFQDLA